MPIDDMVVTMIGIVKVQVKTIIILMGMANGRGKKVAKHGGQSSSKQKMFN